MRRFILGIGLTLAACKGGGGASSGTSNDPGTDAGTDTASTTSQPGTGTPASSGGHGSATSTGTPSTGSGDGLDSSGGDTSGGPPPGEPFVYVSGGSSGIRVFSLDPSTGALDPVGEPVDAGQNPSFLAVSPDHSLLFAVNETGDFKGKPSGAVASFAIDPSTGGLSFVSRVSSAGRGPAHVATDRSGAWLLVPTYTEGNLAVIAIGAGGVLGAAVDVEMNGVGAQSHMVMPSRANDAVFVPNRALDTVAQYTFDAATGALAPNAVPSVNTAPGAGPRHMDFHPTLDRAYVINEDGDTVVVYDYDPVAGQLSAVQTIDTLPAGVDGSSNACADIHVHPSGAFVYGSNRGHDSIVTYAADAADGTLTLVGHEPTGGQRPRNFEVSPDGTLMLVANQDSDNVVAFSIDAITGMPTPTGAVTSVPAPTFVGIVLLPGPG